MDAQAISKLLDYGLLGLLLAISLYAVVALYKKVNEVQEKRVSDSKEREETVVIALQAVTQNLESVGGEIKSIRISLDKHNGKNERQNKTTTA